MAEEKLEQEAAVQKMEDIALTPQDFEVVGINLAEGQTVSRPSVSYWQDAWRRLKKNKTAMLGIFIILIVCIMAIVGPFMVPYTYNGNDLMHINQSPDGEHWFGTDQLGRDIWARVWQGSRVSLAIGVLVALLQCSIGVIIGGISGMLGGKIDMFIMRVVDILNSIPYLIFVILIMVVVGTGIFPLVLAFVITGWLSMARLVRGQILQLREQEYVLAATTLGASKTRLLLRHMIPNIISILIVQLTMAIPSAIFSEAFLSFIGLGIQPPMTSLGQLSRTGSEMMKVYPYQLIIPSIVISLTMLSLNLLGDGLRDALDPRMRQ